METNLFIKTTGVKGGKPKCVATGRAVSMIEPQVGDKGGYIVVDAFEGIGDIYKRREECWGQVYSDATGIVLEGTFSELINKLKTK